MFRQLILCGIVLALSLSKGSAEVITDGTAGPALTLPGPDFRIGVELGTQAGGNLFHSFSALNLAAGESASFSGPDMVQNILARVTGGAPSLIDSTLRSEIPGAALYLFNPAGLAFGPNAVIDLPGAFYASTADTLYFADGQEFSASPPQANGFSSAPPQAFGFLGVTPAPLTLNGSDLRLAEGSRLSLSGGDVKVDYAEVELPNGQIDLAGVAGPGRIELAALTVNAPAGPVEIHDSLVSTSGKNGGQVRIVAGHLVLDEGEITADTEGAGQGQGIQVRADSLLGEDGGRLSSSAIGPGQGGGIRLEVSGAVAFSGQKPEKPEAGNLEGDNGGSNHNGSNGADTSPEPVERDGMDFGDTEISDEIEKNNPYAGLFAYSGSATAPDAGNAGPIEVRAGSLSLQGGARITAETFGAGQGGDVTLEVDGAVELAGLDLAGTGSSVASEARGHRAPAGDAGDVTIRAGALSLDHGASISTSTYGPGRGGEIALEIAGPVVLAGEDGEGGSAIFADANASTSSAPGQPAGDGGGITLSAQSLSLRDGSGIYANTFGPGQGGGVDIQVSGPVEFSGQNSHQDGSEIYVNSHGSGQGGMLNLSAHSLSLADGARITTSAFGLGGSGSVFLDVRDTVHFTGEGREGTSGLYTRSMNPDSGNAGSIRVRGGALELRNGAGIYADTYGSGQGGSIEVETSGPISFAGKSRDGDGSEIYANARGTAPNSGHGGSLSLRAASLDMRDGAKLDTSTYGPGLGGNIEVQIDGTARLAGTSVEGPGGIFTVSAGQGADANRAGAIRLQAAHVELTEQAEINAGTRGPGAGGDIDIVAGEAVLSKQAAITASSQGSGVAGHLLLDITGRLWLNQAGIRTGTDSADGGNIQISGNGYCYLVNSEISTSVKAAQGNGGNIALRNSFLLLDHSRILARAVGGNGGNIAISSHGIYPFSPSTIDASSQFGVSGEIAINSPDTRLGDQLAVLPVGFLDAQSLQQGQCNARGGIEPSRFTISRYAGNTQASQRGWAESGW